MSISFDGSNHVYFGSGIGVKELSNFSKCLIKIEEGEFPSSEHAYQAIQKFEPEEWRRFECGGQFATLEGLGHFYKSDAFIKKLRYWGKDQMVGIVPKMVSAPKRAKSLKLRMRACNPDAEHMHLSAIKPLFKRILLAKYRQNAHHRAKLLETNNKYLIEFGKGAKRETDAGRTPLWTGLVKDGSLYGKNLMGELLMEVRDVIRSECD